MQQAFGDSGIPWHACHHEDRGDSVFILVPPEIPKAHVVAQLPGAVARRLTEHNATHRAREQVRVRMAVHAGEVHPDSHGFTSAAINLAFRLLDARQFRTALADSPGVLVLVLSPWFYDEVVRHGVAPDPRTFRPVDVKVKGTTATAWIARPDSPYPAIRTPRSEASRRKRAVAIASAAVVSPWVLVAGAPAVRGGDIAGLGIGRNFPGTTEFLAYVVNRATGNCLARNGPHTHPTDSDTPGQDAYQWDCAGSDNPGHVVLPAPVAGYWSIRSSVRADLCLAADGKPGTDQHSSPRTA